MIRVYVQVLAFATCLGRVRRLAFPCAMGGTLELHLKGSRHRSSSRSSAMHNVAADSGGNACHAAAFIDSRAKCANRSVVCVPRSGLGLALTEQLRTRGQALALRQITTGETAAAVVNADIFDPGALPHDLPRVIETDHVCHWKQFLAEPRRLNDPPRRFYPATSAIRRAIRFAAAFTGSLAKCA